MRFAERLLAGAARPSMAALGLLALLSCSRNPVEPRLPQLEVVVAGGDGQYGTAGLELPLPLRVVVRASETKLPVADLDILWEVTSGDASIPGPDVGVTSEAGVVEIALRLGTLVGEVSISATVATQPAATVELRAFLVGTPVLASVEPVEVAAGGTVSLEGENFSPVADQNVVLFSGIRGRVTSATNTRLTVEVPDCLPSRGAIGVRAGFGVVSSDSLMISVVSGGTPLVMAIGEHLDLDDPGGFDCVRLSGQGGARYLAMPYASSTVAAAQYPLRMTGLAASGGQTAPLQIGDAFPGAVGPFPPQAGLPAQERFETALRLEEEALIETRDRTHQLLPEALLAPAAAPAVGQKRNFFVFNGGTDPATRFDEITATVRYVGSEVAIYVDDDAPSGGFTDGDLQDLAARFDQVIHPTVVGTFGPPSDLDGTARVAVLFTPVVNQLTPRGSDSFVGGFFFGRDLMPELSSSNAAEVFYALVPDPEGIHSDPRDRTQVVNAVPAILAHEFQHMVHFNQRVLLGGATQDALWMLEGLAQMAEELTARAYESAASPLEAELFRDGNRRRARLYLARPDTTSLIVSSGRGTLAERGAGMLFLLYLHQHYGGDLLGRLTRSTVTGIANVQTETGKTWSALFPDWAAATLLDGGGVGDGPLAYPGLDLRAFLGDPAPFHVRYHGGSDFAESATLLSASHRYFVITPPIGGELSLAMGGAGGGSHAPGAGLGLRLVRIH